MFIDQLKLVNVRTFVKVSIPFVHPDKRFSSDKSEAKNGVPRPRLPNVNLLLGDNGSGKSTILRSIAMAAFGAAMKESGLRDPGLIRRENGTSQEGRAQIASTFTTHEQDLTPLGAPVESELTVQRRGDLELYDFTGPDSWQWEAVFESKNDAFFVAGYGATRRVERPEAFDMGARTKARFARVQRVASLFEDWFSLIPLTYWLPGLAQKNPERYTEITQLLHEIPGVGHYQFTGELEQGDYLFERNGHHVPFFGLSDGYRALFGWVGDLLYHLNFACPPEKRLQDCIGLVMVDEIDLHLHPEWQMLIIETIASAFPRLQFVFTSHSPLVVGSLEWMNINSLKTNAKTNRTAVKRIKIGVHGLDADQILLTEFFGLKDDKGARESERTPESATPRTARG